MKTVQHVNILIIGRTRTGKSTIKTLLVDPTNIPDELTLKSGTKDPHFQSFHLNEKNNVLNIIDTPGLFERSSNEIDIRDNETIMNTIKMCANMEITKFHAICFCVSLTNGINEQDITSTEKLIEYMGPEISKNSCLIITHCESKTEAQREKLKEELIHDAHFRNIARFFKLGIYFSGSINRDDFLTASDNIVEQFFTISEYRQKLINLFLSVKDPLPIADMRISLARSNAAAKKKIETELQKIQVYVEEQEHIIAEFQQKGAFDEQRIKKLMKNYNKAVTQQEQLRSQLYKEKETDTRY
uniref:AIG1-like protein n=1 Tax=Adineta vaga TaxID=104782 RepID=B3G465_ADIVA|nr:AIG1-like protein [Adineta vaga]